MVMNHNERWTQIEIFLLRLYLALQLLLKLIAATAEQLHNAGGKLAFT
jgi:hypothetical protein